MNILKFFYKKKSIKRKIFDIKDDIMRAISAVCEEKHSIYWYGSYDIDPKNLAFWICVNSDEMKNKLEQNKELKKQLKNLLIKYEYPQEAINDVFIGFESQETVDRESNGDWYLHFK